VAHTAPATIHHDDHHGHHSYFRGTYVLSNPAPMLMLRIITTCLRLAALLTLVFVITNVNANTFESLLMPGPVIKGHAKYEQKCDQCHDTSGKKQQGRLCVKCHAHENILDDINSQGGDCSEIDRWLNGGWNAHINGLSFNNFEVKPFEGYFVKCSQGSSFTPSE